MRSPNELEPLPYHREILAWLKEEQKDLWNWFASHRVQREYADAVRLDLLKTTYRVDAETAPELHERANGASARLGIDGPITLYQSQRVEGLNASLAFVPEEIHIVLHGPIRDVLSTVEIEALLGHELSHRLLWTRWGGEFHVADQILAALTGDASADPAQCESARLFRLYTEIFCDRGSLLASGEVAAAVGALVKTETGLKEVSAESYLRQAEEVFSKDTSATERVTHPESFIRARALRLWHEQAPDAESEIRRMIEGSLSLSRLDLLGQARVAKLTRRLVDLVLVPGWMQSETIIGHARLFFEEYQPPTARHSDDALAGELQPVDDQLKDYFCYVLLDFVTTDRDLEDAPLAAAFLLAEKLGLVERFEPIVRKELDLRKKQWDKLKSEAAIIVVRAEQAEQVS